MTAKKDKPIARDSPGVNGAGVEFLLPIGQVADIIRQALPGMDAAGRKSCQAILDEMDEYAALERQGIAVPPYLFWKEQRRIDKAVSAAAAGKSAQRKDSEAQILERWHALERLGKPVRNRNTIIARQLNLDRSTVSRVTSKINVCASRVGKIP